jgi:type III pantothenate kinase
MILVFDVGNTNMVIGVYQGKELLTHWRIKTDEGRTSDEYGMLLKNLFDFNGLSMSSITAVVISSVVPSLMMELERVSRDYYSSYPDKHKDYRPASFHLVSPWILYPGEPVPLRDDICP